MDRPAGDPLRDGLAAGRHEAFAALYDRFGPALYRVARALVRSAEDAEDAVQEVFVGLVRARRGLPAVRDLRAYLFAALRRAAARRRAGREKPAPLDAVPAREPPAVETDEAVRLEKALALLPPGQREVIALKVDGGLTFAEIADLLGISPNTAASRYRYALEKLRAALMD